MQKKKIKLKMSLPFIAFQRTSLFAVTFPLVAQGEFFFLNYVI